MLSVSPNQRWMTKFRTSGAEHIDPLPSLTGECQRQAWLKEGSSQPHKSRGPGILRQAEQEGVLQYREG